MAKQHAEFIFTTIWLRRAKSAYAVSLRHPDGRTEPVGTTALYWYPHIKSDGWEAVGADGHRAVHQFRWQAAKALAWNGNGYPFPFLNDRSM